MISYLKGQIQYIDDNSLSILANGIGWELHTYIPDQFTAGQDAEFYVYTHFRESEISLWGFKSLQELKCFKMLISVSGVGPKTAQTLVGDRGVDQICFAILNNDPSILRVPGVGSKTSQKIIIELKTKISKLNYDPKNIIAGQEYAQGSYPELTEALTTLGYKYNDIQTFISKLDPKEKYKTEDLIKKFLRNN